MIQKKSIVLWNVLVNLSKCNDMKIFDYGQFNFFYYTDQKESFPSVFKTVLVNEKLLLTEKNELVSPNEVFLKELPKQFHADDKEVFKLCSFLNIKTRDVELLTQEFIDDHEFVQKLDKYGLLNKVKKELTEKESKNTKEKK